jgi:Xaa-Pro aminopeptidase
MNTPYRRTTVAALAMMVTLASPTRAGELSDDLTARRARVMDELGPNSMLILMSAPRRNYSLDVHYPYRQDSNLYYLTGIAQPDTMLVLMPGNTGRRDLLFIQDSDPVQEHWNGPLLSPEEATARSGISTILSSSRFEPFLASVLSSTPSAPLDERVAEAFLAALEDGTARIALALDPRGTSDPLSPALELGRRLEERYLGFQLVDATRILTDLRLVKTPYERQLLTKSLEIANEAQRAGMRAARPGAYEYEVKAAVEAVHIARGAVSWSFPSIVGSGSNTTILHSPNSDRQMRDGDLMLVDAAANYEYMSGDLTRTYPVNGRFTQAQRDIYELVLRAQQAAIAIARPGATLKDLHEKATEVLKTGLLKLGLITDADSEQHRMWFTHSTCHYIGIDVHDVGGLNEPLRAGMAFVIEPGLYIRQAAIDGLPSTPENGDLIDAIRPAVAKYLDIGIRIEDAFILEDSGLRRLTAAAPRTIEEIESFLSR